MEIRIRTSCGRDAFRDGSGANSEVRKARVLKIALAVGDEAASQALDCFPIWRMLRAESTFYARFGWMCDLHCRMSVDKAMRPKSQLLR